MGLSINREKVSKGKEHLDAIMEIATHLSYPDYGIVQEHCLAILAMLKEQEAIEPRKEDDGNQGPCTCWWYVCGSCGRNIDPQDRFCRHCGRPVKWE